jgi:tetratricopeptide (TPR) repeat protein
VRQRTGLGGLVFFCAVAITVGGCTVDDEAPATEQSLPGALDELGLQPTPLPDLSHMTVAVREQIRQQYSPLMTLTATTATSAIEQTGAPSVELSDAYGEMGNVLMAAQFIDAPESFYLNANALAPTDRRWPYYLGHLYKTQGEFTKAEASFEQALALGSADVPTMLALGDVHLEQGRPGAAEPLFTQALSIEPGSVWARLGLGRAALTRQDYAKAVEHLEEALTVDQRATSIHYPLAMAYRGLGELEKAEAHLQQRDIGTVQPDPLMETMHQSLRSASTYEREGMQALSRADWEAAAASFRQGIELAPANPSLRHRLGTALSMMGDERESVAQFEEALRVSPEYVQAHYSLGLVMEAGGRFAEAFHRFSTAIRYQPSYVEARLRLARLLRRIGRPSEALLEYAQVIDDDPRLVEAPFGYAMALVGLGRYQEAQERLAEGLTLYPDQPIYAHALARLLAAAPDERARDGQRAVMLLQELLTQQRSFDLGEAMAMALAEVGQYDEAAMWQRDVMSVAEQTGRGDLTQRLAENLRLYERGEACRTPWLDDDMP